MRYIWASLNTFMLATILIVSCNGSNKSEKGEVQNDLGIMLPDEVKDLKYFKINYDENYKRPYCVYIKFVLREPYFYKFVQQLELMSHDSDYKTVMCLNRADGGFISRLWEFKEWINRPASVEKLNWWNPGDKGLKLYLSFYREGLKKRIEHCYSNQWDGWILLGYDSTNETVFILLQVLA